MSQINPDQIKGGGGGGGNVPKTVTFSYSTPSPLVIQAVTSGQIFYEAVIAIITAFNDPSTTLQLGTTATPNLIFGITDINAMAIDQYINEAVFTISSNDFLILTISPGASIQGIGTLYYWIK
jgi:hypothetical protein